MTKQGFDESGNMTEDVAQFDLKAEIADSETKKPWAAGLYSKTLFKKHDFRTVLICMQRAALMKEHHADGTVSVQVLKGRVKLGVQGKGYEVGAGGMLALGASVKHDVEATEDAAFLLTISWPKSEDLKAMEHRGYGQ